MVETVFADEGYDSNMPFSQGRIHNDVLYTAGQVPKDPETSEIVGEGIEEQTRQTMKNLDAILNAAGTSFENVLKATVFLTNMSDYEEFNETYRELMPEPHPGRSTVEVSNLAIDVKVEIEMTVALTE